MVERSARRSLDGASWGRNVIPLMRVPAPATTFCGTYRGAAARGLWSVRGGSQALSESERGSMGCKAREPDAGFDHRSTGRGRRWARRLALAAVLVLGACQGDLPWMNDDEAGPGPGADETPPSSFDRRFLFLPEAGASPITAIVFDFGVLHDSEATRRTARVLLADSAWSLLMDEAWRMDPMREPWRLVPHQSLRILVGETGDVEALRLDGDSIRFLPGPTLAEYAPDGATQFQLRDAVLQLDSVRLQGVLLDLQSARPLDEADSPPPRDLARTDTAPASPVGYTADALVLDDAGFRMVIGHSATGPIVWLHHPQWQDVWDGAALAPAEYGLAQPAGRTVPIAWHLILASGDTAAELRVAGTDYATGTDDRLHGAALVRGWIEISGERRDLRGVLRHTSE